MTHTAIIKYKNPDAIKILKDIGKFLDFTIEKELKSGGEIKTRELYLLMVLHAYSLIQKQILEN